MGAETAVTATPTSGPYQRVIVFDESEAEPIVADVVVFDDAEVAPIVGGIRPSPYDAVVAFSDAEGLTIGAAPDAAALARQMDRATSDPVVVTTGPEDRPDWWPGATNGISFELHDAWQLPPPDGVRAELPLPQTQVLSWLQHHRSEIRGAAREFRVDPRAIAGAIAWEALQNARTVSLRSVGPGKVHVDADVVTQTEQTGLLPVRTSAQRRELLRRPGQAIRYIAAIMSAKAAIAEAFGYSMRDRPDLLTNEYVARSLTEWTDHLTERPAGDLVAAEDMALWTRAHLRYLERGVGTR
ncbi:hypothetical protein [Catenuloplanes atrovinosus]|uniref:Uncharacterized protein n=1 Tax=Catenuloplanes atrovinosus TaxID=137266 RepID=A0AAE4C896_9ACTN|nr:hypothetical protein [Catenuloplanes atrovinosus]MDR7274422.1 hypothetical protein [Catenuloplanes atrovinosus]